MNMGLKSYYEKIMDGERNHVRRNRNVRENVRQEVPQVPVNPLVEQVTSDEFRDAFHALAQATTAQENREVVAPIKPRVGIAATWVRDFTRMNPLEFHGSKFDEYPQEFIGEVYKIVEIMGITSLEKAELSAYQLKGVAKVWFNQWKEEREVDVGPLDWE
ncbi:hypothetical protein MTR67_040118 [Solanum verrucosum]|uniref:Gag-pol polyprotein n=1 Tax=Solanum verrucosum TaxID=315347 RepID=A0AAF0UI19_SOLVR|nr:hypothetical protein MTR67_040118 [Solanum verrucosum]